MELFSPIKSFKFIEKKTIKFSILECKVININENWLRKNKLALLDKIIFTREIYHYNLYPHKTIF